MKYLPRLTILTALLLLLLACISRQPVIANQSTPSVISSRFIATKTPQPTKSASLIYTLTPTETPPAWLVRLRKTPSPTPVPSPTPTVTSASADELPTDIPSEASLNLSEHQFPSGSPFVVIDEVVYLKVTMDEQVYRLTTVFSQETIMDYCKPNMSGTKWLCMLSNSFFDNLQTRDEIDALLQSVGDDEERLNLAIEELVTDYSMYPPVLIISENDELIDFLPENEDLFQNPNWKTSCYWLSDDKLRCHVHHGTESWTTTLFDLGKGAYIPLPENGDNIEIFGDYFLRHYPYPHPETILLYDQNHTQLYKFVALAGYISDEILVLVELSEDGLHYFHYIKLENGIIEDDVRLNLSDYFPAGGDNYDVYLTVEAGSYDVTICHDEIVCDKKIRISSDNIQVIEVFYP